MDRLVELFLRSARPDGDTGGQHGALDDDDIERGVAAVEKMVTSPDAASMAAAPAATFVCLAMALEEKPKLGLGSIRCYERALGFMGNRGAGEGSWERLVVLQQLGAVCLRSRRLEDAERWLAECAGGCSKATGHPRDERLFGGNFSTQQTRLEFTSQVEKLRAATYHHLGDTARSQEHLRESERLETCGAGDAVGRSVPRGAGPAPAAGGADEAARSLAELWAVPAPEERRITEYSFADEGSTVLLMVELNEHLGIGEAASALISSLRQFRVHCTKDSVDASLRLRLGDKVWQFQLLLQPLAREIVPEDTVPRLKGRESKRRLEIKLFKRDKQQRWSGDLVADGGRGKAIETKAQEPEQPQKGSLLNPLTAEELARLPRPGGDSGSNRPSGWARGAGALPQPVAGGAGPLPPRPAQEAVGEAVPAPPAVALDELD